MANLPESASFDAGIYQIETTDPVLGGVDGISNAQAKGLANRTTWLKQQVDALNALKGKGIGAFSAANSYSGGDQVIYQKNIWQANTAITPGAFNPGNWTRQLGVAAESALANALPLVNGAAAVGTSTDLAREDHVHPVDTSRAPLASPALTGNPTAPTAAQFDNDTSIATTEFVQRALGNFSKLGLLSGSRSLTASDIGSVIWTSASGVTLTMPTPTSLGIQPGGRVTLFCTSNQLIIAPGGGVTLQGINGFSIGSLTVKPGQSLALVASELAKWQVLLSTADLGSNADFGASLTSNGYQKLPSGLIIQWGFANAGNIANNTFITSNYPIAFPNGVLSLSGASSSSSATKTYPLVFEKTSNSLFKVAFNGPNGSATAAADWIAIGY